MNKKFFTKEKIEKKDILILALFLLFVFLLIVWKAFDFSAYSFGKTIDQGYMAKEIGGKLYVVDLAHERISAVGENGKILWSLEEVSDGSETIWYIDDFAVSDDGTTYVSCTEWDGFYLSKEAIFQFDAKGKFLKRVFYREYESKETNKHRVVGLEAIEDTVTFLFLDGDYIREMEAIETGVTTRESYAYVNAYNEIADADYYNQEFYVLSKKGFIKKLATEEILFTIENTKVEDGAPYSFDIASDGTQYVTDIKNRMVYSYDEESGVVPVVENTDTLSVFCEDNTLCVADYASASVFRKNSDGTFAEEKCLTKMQVSFQSVFGIAVKVGMLVLTGVLAILILIRGYFILRKIKISSTAKTEAAILVLVSAIILILLSMMLKQFKVSYRDNLVDQMSMTAYSIASVITPEDLDSIQDASDFGSESYERIWKAMDNFFFGDISLSKQMYCNILKWDEGDAAAYAVAYYDQSIGTYFPLDEEESEEVIRVYQTGAPVWNAGKEDVAGTFLYIKTPVVNEANEVVGVVSVGMDTYIMDDLVNEMRDNTLVSIVTILFLIIIAGSEVVAMVNARNKYGQICKGEPERKVLPIHFVRLLVFTVFAAYNMSAAFLPVYVLNHSDVRLPFGKELVASLPITVNIFILGVMSLFCSKMVRRLGIKKLALLSGLSSFAGNMLILFVPSYFAIFGGLILDGIGVGLMSNAIYIIITYVKNESDRTEGFATYNAGCISGINFGMMTGAILAVNIGQRYVFLVVAGLWLVIIELVILICKQAGTLFAPADSEEELVEKKNVSILLKDKFAMSFFILIQNPYIIFNSFVFYFVPIFCDENGYNETMTSILLMVYSLCAVYLSDFLTKKSMELFKYKAMHVASLLNLLAVALYAWTQSMPGLVVALILLGISASFGKSVQQTYYCELNSVKKYGEDNAMGVYNFTENIGESLGPIVFSYLMGAQALRLVVSAFCGCVAGLGGIHFGMTRGCKKIDREV